VSDTETPALPVHIRKVFEQFGVIKPAPWPKLDVLVKKITTRKYRYDIQTDHTGLVTARVFAGDETFTAVDGEPERALARAFYDCLKETGSAQLGMFNDDDSDDEDESAGNTIATFSWTNADGSERTSAATTLAKLNDITKQATTRTVDGETFELDDMGRYVNSETGEYLDAFVVPRPMASGR
jgi:hypothetical protein